MTQVDFDKMGGLVPAILQDALTHQVLMLGYMNQEAYEKTKEEKVAWFYSRSKQRLWKKGETSGNIQRVVSLSPDCDQDVLLVEVIPEGPTCHRETVSCFDQDYFNLEVLERTILDKINHPQEGSYTDYLVKSGLDKQLKKVGEEATEVVIAAKNQDKDELINETGDLLYHVLVMLNTQGVRLNDVIDLLSSRHGKKQVYSVRSEIEKW